MEHRIFMLNKRKPIGGSTGKVNSIIILNVIMLSVVMLNVVAPKYTLHSIFKHQFYSKILAYGGSDYNWQTHQAWSNTETANKSEMRLLHSSTACPVFNKLLT